jgi:hypothetical protein
MIIMAYYNPRNPQNEPGQESGYNFRAIPGQLWDVLRSGTAGFKQGLLGKNDMSFEQWQREQKRRQRGLPPSQYPDSNWLQRLMRLK